MTIKIVAFGIAKDILKARSIDVNMEQGDTVADLKEKLIAAYPAFSALRSLRLAINQEYVADIQEIHATDEIVIIPPVSGG